MIAVKIDEEAILRECKQRITELLKQVDADLVFWDRNELQKRTCMSWNYIQDNFFFDPRFKKKKVGGKWLFPAKEGRQFLELWLSEQPDC
ncbi:group-specific protein [Paenibacillus gansuensis]|uniref:Group-specific protein n=1 Tax=Paenibacillus gansuensis TaxID=306542 RepID=A0ABW5PFK6_9BACL